MEQFKEMGSQKFWLDVNEEFYILKKLAIETLLPFPTTCKCEAGFSAYSAMKTKYRNRLNCEPDMILQLSDTEPDLKKLFSMKQPHKSH